MYELKSIKLSNSYNIIIMTIITNASTFSMYFHKQENGTFVSDHYIITNNTLHFLIENEFATLYHSSKHRFQLTTKSLLLAL